MLPGGVTVSFGMVSLCFPVDSGVVTAPVLLAKAVAVSPSRSGSSLYIRCEEVFP